MLSAAQPSSGLPLLPKRASSLGDSARKSGGMPDHLGWASWPSVSMAYRGTCEMPARAQSLESNSSCAAARQQGWQRVAWQELRWGAGTWYSLYVCPAHALILHRQEGERSTKKLAEIPPGEQLTCPLGYHPACRAPTDQLLRLRLCLQRQ